MAAKPLTRDLIDAPDHWRLSLLVNRHSLDVLARALNRDEVIVASLPYDASCESQAQALEEVVYANPMLIQPWAAVDVALVSDRVQILPAEVAADADAVDAVVDILGLEGIEPLVSPIDGRYSEVVAVDKDVMRFLRRTFDSARISGHIGILARYFSRRSRLGNTSKLYVNLRRASVDVLAFDSLGLASAATFDASADVDAVYYALAVLQTSGMNRDTDEIMVSGDAERRPAVMTELLKYAVNVMPTVFPSAMYRGNHDVLSAPFELIIMPLCE